MKKYLLLFLLIVFGGLPFSCSKWFDGDGSFSKGLVTFGTRPYYQNNHVLFRAQMQYGVTGRATDIEYKLLDGSQVIATGVAKADKDKTGLKIIFESNLVSVPVPQEEYAGKYIVVFLDPSFKLVADEYLDQALTWQTDTLFVPYSFR